MSTAPPTQRRPDLDTLYCLNPDGSRNTIHTADVRGRYQVRKKLVWAVLVAIYLILPWVQVGGRQAILIDIQARHFYLFGHTFNAQDFYLAFFFLTGIGFGLIVVSALWGRIWCGFACPHTVFLEGFFRRIERWIDGPPAKQKELRAMPWNGAKVRKRVVKHGLYLAMSFVLAHTLLSWFVPARELGAIVTGSPAAHPTAFGFVLLATGLMYLNFSWFREQLCLIVCPYGRLQSVLYDRDTVQVTYDHTRGEPRGKYHAEGRGHCIDCYRCVAVCPTGIDIRNGSQMECVGCSNCVDACDEVMAKLGQPKGLIRYDSLNGIESGSRRFWRPRVFLYGVLLLVGLGVFTFAASRRTGFEASLLRMQGPLFEVQGEQVRNGLTLHLINKLPRKETFTLEVGVHDAGVPVPAECIVPVPESDGVLRVELDSLRDLRVPVFVLVPRDAVREGIEVRVVVRGGGEERVARAKFAGPLQR
ncbi:MAG: cytochrome c oxidase accessory protein CcoG [Planctomycetes bacterium]|nr:cytochrome c oxidase accessory protein CcoG [Planctomycetota bacterium]